MEIRGPSATGNAASNPVLEKQTRSTASDLPTPNPAVLVDLSAAGRAAANQSQGTMTATQTPPPSVPTLPPVLVQAISVKVNDYETFLRSQQPPGVPDYGQIARQVNMFYSQQYGLAGSAMAWVNQHVTVDPSVDLSDPEQAAAVNQIKSDLTASVYQAMSSPSSMINGPDSVDMSAGDWFTSMQNVDLTLMGGTNPNSTAAETNINGPRTTITIWPSMVSGYFGNLSDAASATTILYHELGHAALRQEATARFNAWYTAQLGSPHNMTQAQALAAWPTSAAAILDQQRATAFGQGLATMTGGTIAQTYSGSSIAHGSAPQ